MVTSDWLLEATERPFAGGSATDHDVLDTQNSRRQFVDEVTLTCRKGRIFVEQIDEYASHRFTANQ